MITQFIMAALFAGQLNSGVNAAWLLLYLASSPYWPEKVRSELYSTCATYATNEDAPLIDQLATIPFDVWESDFPTMDICLKDSIRLQALGAGFRRNMTGKDLKLGREVIPKGAVVSMHIDQIHFNPEIYAEPEKWDPARYLPARAEDKKEPYAWAG